MNDDISWLVIPFLFLIIVAIYQSEPSTNKTIDYVKTCYEDGTCQLYKQTYYIKPETNEVLYRSVGDSLTGSYDDCVVFDRNNWECGGKDLFDYHIADNEGRISDSSLFQGIIPKIDTHLTKWQYWKYKVFKR